LQKKILPHTKGYSAGDKREVEIIFCKPEASPALFGRAQTFSFAAQDNTFAIK